jgi:hypothetical protein
MKERHCRKFPSSVLRTTETWLRMFSIMRVEEEGGAGSAKGLVVEEEPEGLDMGGISGSKGLGSRGG